MGKRDTLILAILPIQPLLASPALPLRRLDQLVDRFGLIERLAD
jgi:hypothetical protein